MKQNIFSYRIYYEDTDSGGVVYYANYLKFFERARTDFLRQKGVIQSEMANKFGLIFVVKNCQIDYVKPAKLDDYINISVDILEINNASLKLSQIIKRNDEILTTLTVNIVCVNSLNFKPTRINKEILSLIK